MKIKIEDKNIAAIERLISETNGPFGRRVSCVSKY